MKMKQSIPFVLFMVFFLTIVIQVSAKNDEGNRASSTEIQSLNERSASDSSKLIMVNSDPDKAAVFINGSFEGITPMICSVKSNFVEISIKRNGYYPTGTSTFLSDGNFSFSFKLLKLNNFQKQLASPFYKKNEFQILGVGDKSIMDATNSSYYQIKYPYKEMEKLNLTYEEQADFKRYNNRVKAFAFIAIGCGAVSFISFSLAEVNYRNYKTTSQYADEYRKTVQTYDFIAVTSLAVGILSTGFAIYYGTLKRKITKPGRINVGIVSSEFGPAVALNLKIK